MLLEVSLAGAPTQKPAAALDGPVREAVPSRATVAIADDHLLMAQGLAGVLARDFDVIAAVNNAAELLAMAADQKIDVALIDICMPGLTGIQAARLLRESVPACKVILISMYGRTEFVREAFSAGAAGYFVKSGGGDELLDAVRDVLSGNHYVSPCIATDVMGSFLGVQAAALSPRLIQVLVLVAEGCSAKEIAARLSISVKTVQFHKGSIMTKLGVRGIAELTRYALDRGIVSC